MARKQKRDPQAVAIAKAILKQYNCITAKMQKTTKDIFGPIFEAMLQWEMASHLGYETNTILKAQKSAAMDTAVKPRNALTGILG